MTVQYLFIIIAILAVFLTALRVFNKNANGYFLTFVQYFLGSLFIFSGIVKGIDPLGTAYKMHEYFSEFSKEGFAGFWDSMVKFDVAFSVSMIVFEIMLGIAILVGWKGRWTSVLMLAINVFFLFLTGYSYLSGYCISKISLAVALFILLLLMLASLINNNKKRHQAILSSLILMGIFVLYCKASGTCFLCEFSELKMKVKDCGCFGDFMKLKPWQTFNKDILLTFLSIFLVWYKNDIVPVFKNGLGFKIVGLGTIVALLFCFYNFKWNEPLVDFRPYAIGNDIKKKMEVIEPSVIENILVYQNTITGNVDSFTIDKIPTDTIWKFKDRIDKVIKEGIPAPISNLRLEDIDRNEITPSLLNEPNISYWIVSYNLEKADKKAWIETMKPFAKQARAKGISVYALFSAADSSFIKEIGTDFDIVLGDETPLKTMVRSNPGVLKIQNGVVLNKWHAKHFNEKNNGL